MKQVQGIEEGLDSVDLPVLDSEVVHRRHVDDISRGELAHE
jgi:hypothetical protein